MDDIENSRQYLKYINGGYYISREFEIIGCGQKVQRI